MIIYHVTHRDNLRSIRKTGIDTDFSQGVYPYVWGVKRGMIPWACVHCLRRHGGKAEELVVIEIAVHPEFINRFKGGLWYSKYTWTPQQIHSVQSFSEYVLSTKGVVA